MSDAPDFMWAVPMAVIAGVPDWEAGGEWYNAEPPADWGPRARYVRADILIAYLAPWATESARALGLPLGHLHPQHYDTLANCGARMAGFTRAETGE